MGWRGGGGGGGGVLLFQIKSEAAVAYESVVYKKPCNLNASIDFGERPFNNTYF